MAFDIARARVLITGGNTGIGKATAVALARLGAEVTITSRDPGRGAAATAEIRAASGNERVDVVPLDLGTLDATRESARDILDDPRPITVLINNAGVAALGRRRETTDAFEQQLGVNHFGHFLFTNLLVDRIRASAPARIVTVSSAAYGLAPHGMRWHDLHWTEDYDGWKAYGQSKLANLYFTWELADQLAGAGVTANALHPGYVDTELGHRRPEEHSTATRPAAPPGEKKPTVDISLLGQPLSAEDGARTSVLLASSPVVDGVTGAYFNDSQERQKLTGIAVDREEARKLWDLTTAAVG